MRGCSCRARTKSSNSTLSTQCPILWKRRQVYSKCLLLIGNITNIYCISMQKTTSPKAPIHQDSFDTVEFRTPRGSLTSSVLPKKGRNLLCKLVYTCSVPHLEGSYRNDRINSLQWKCQKHREVALMTVDFLLQCTVLPTVISIRCRQNHEVREEDDICVFPISHRSIYKISEMLKRFWCSAFCRVLSETHNFWIQRFFSIVDDADMVTPPPNEGKT